MVNHIVLFYMKDKSEVNLQKTKELLLSMRDEIPEIRKISVGIDFLHSERSCDIALEVVVDDEAALEAYQNHPYHVEVIKKYMHAARLGSVSADYVMD